MSNANTTKFISRVSSTLNNDSKSYGKQYMFDDNEESCWNSDQGSPQWIELLFKEVCLMRGFEIQFQGGFVGLNCVLQLYKNQPNNNSPPDSEFQDFYPEDINSPQKYILKHPVSVKFLRLIFNCSSDFYGRVIVYRFNIF